MPYNFTLTVFIYTLYFANQRQHITDMKTILQTFVQLKTVLDTVSIMFRI